MKLLTLVILGFALYQVSSAQVQTLENEVTAFVNKVWYSDDGLSSFYFDDDRKKIRLDTRDWETTLAEIISSPPDDNYSIAETAIGIVKLRETAHNPEISKAISSMLMKWANHIRSIEAAGSTGSAESDYNLRSDLYVHKGLFNGFAKSALELNEPNVIQSVLEFAISENEKNSPLFDKYARKGLAEATLNFGDNSHLDGLKVFITTLNGDEDSLTRQIALKAISKIKGASTDHQARETNETTGGNENNQVNIGLSEPASHPLNNVAVAIILAISIVILFLIVKIRRS